MSGGEVVQLIDACISLTKAVISIGQAVKDVNGLPKKLAKLFEQLPAVQDLFEEAQKTNDNLSIEVRKRAEPTLKNCKNALSQLHELFEKICPQEGDKTLKRVWKGTTAQVLGRNSDLQNVWMEVESYLDLLQKKQILDIGNKLDGMKETMKSLAQEESTKYTHTGLGHQIVTEGGSPIIGIQSGTGGTYHQHNGPTYISQTPRVADLNNACLQSLAFPYMNIRRGVSAKTPGTCEWFMSHLTYVEWTNSSGLLWVEGRPGTGKTMIMKSASETEAKLSSSSHRGNSSSPDMRVASHFFNGQGETLEHTELGLLRSLLHHVFTWDPSLLPEFRQATGFDKRFQEKGKPGGAGKRWDWTEDDITEDIVIYYVQRCRQSSETRYVRLYIDAIDEAGEDCEKIATYLTRLCRESSYGFSICVSGRPWPTPVPESDFCIHVEDENREDIATFLQMSLRDPTNVTVEAELSKIREKIAERASGVFQWAVLVVKRVQDFRKAKVRNDRILAEIAELPRELGDLYQTMFSDLHGFQLTLALPILRWITFSVRPLSLEELRYAVSSDTCSPLNSIQECSASEHWCESDSDMSSRAFELCKGLIIITTIDSRSTQLVQFSHESVRDYMSQTGIAFLEQQTQCSNGGSLIGQAHHRCLLTCFRYMKVVDQAYPDAPDPRQFACSDLRPLWFTPPRKTPFMSYAVRASMIHARLAEEAGIPQDDLIEITDWPSNRMFSLRAYDEWHHLESLPAPTTLQDFAAACGLLSVLRPLFAKCEARRSSFLSNIWSTIFSENSMIPRPDDPASFGQNPLWFAATMGQDRVVELLLSMKRVDVNFKEGKEGTPLFVAARGGHDSVIRLLLKTNKVKIDSTDWKGDTALSAAAAGGHEIAVRLLLGTGKASVTTVNRDGETPLMRAARRGQLKTVELLLKEGDAKPDFDAARCAAYGGHRAIVEVLLDTSKADVNKFLVENPLEVIPTISALGGDTTTLNKIAKFYADQPVRLWSRDGVY